MVDRTKEVNDLLDNVATAIKNLVTLRVATVVCPLTVIALDDTGHPTEDPTKAVDWKLAPPPAGTADAWCTEINLLNGQIRDTLTQQFATGAYASLTDFHKSQVTQAKDIVHNNIDALISLAKSVKDFI